MQWLHQCRNIGAEEPGTLFLLRSGFFLNFSSSFSRCPAYLSSGKKVRFLCDDPLVPGRP